MAATSAGFEKKKKAGRSDDFFLGTTNFLTIFLFEDLSGRRTSRYRRRPGFSPSMPLLVFWPHAGAWGAGVILPPCAQLLWHELYVMKSLQKKLFFGVIIGQNQNLAHFVFFSQKNLMFALGAKTKHLISEPLLCVCQSTKLRRTRRLSDGFPAARCGFRGRSHTGASRQLSRASCHRLQRRLQLRGSRRRTAGRSRRVVPVEPIAAPPAPPCRRRWPPRGALTCRARRC